MQYTIRAFVSGRDERIEGICRAFPSMERTAYNLLRDDAGETAVVRVLQERYGVTNWKWSESAINQAKSILKSQEEVLKYTIELYEEKISNTKEKIKHISNTLKIQGCKAKIAKLKSKINELREQLRNRSYPRAVFGSSDLLRKLRILTKDSKRREELRKEWKERRSNHFFSVGQANVKGNRNTRLSYDNRGKFCLEIRNWPPGDFKLDLDVPKNFSDILKEVIDEAESVKFGACKPLDRDEGLAYSIRVVRCASGYQILVSFERQGHSGEWNGNFAGFDINPEGIACTISKDGNLIATRFFKDNRLISASANKRKWVLENIINKALRWCKNNYNCNVVSTESLKLRGAYDSKSTTNRQLSNFMKRKMLQTIELGALKMDMLHVKVNPNYTSRAAIVKYGKQFGGFNRHQLAAFVIARRALGYGEAPTDECIPKTSKDKIMWNYSIKYYGYSPQLQTLPRHEPMEWKSDGDVNGEGRITELPKARPTNTSSMRLSHNAPVESCTGAVDASELASRRVGSTHPNPHTKEGDGARGDRVNPPPLRCFQSSVTQDTEDTGN